MRLSSIYLLKRKYQQYYDSFKEGMQSVFDIKLLTKYFSPSQMFVLTYGSKEISSE